MKKFFQSCAIAVTLCVVFIIPAIAQTDNCGYPDNSNLPRSAVIFNESGVLRTFSPASGGTASLGAGQTIKVWYNDEHALLLGIREVKVKTSGGTTTTTYPVTATPGSPGCATNPMVGSTIQSGDQAGVDVAAGGGRPIFPTLFITNITSNPFSRSGTWQQGGTGIPPHKVCGQWKGATKLVDKTVNPNKITITTDADPAKNNWNGIPDAPPGVLLSSITNEGYGAEVTWNVDNLGLSAGTYLFQFMVHDGDQNKTGGDVGEACTIITITDCNATPIIASATSTSNATCSQPCPTTGEQLCFKSPTVPNIVNAVSTWTIDQNAQTITIRTTLAKTFVDNTYGTGAIGWPNGHTFSNLTGSDNLELALYDANGLKKIDFKMDYITSSNTVPSGFKTLGVTGGEGQMILGTATDVLNVKTSLSENFNTSGYVLTTNSPATDANYTPNAAQPNWIYEVWYEATVKLSVFGATGFGFPDIASVHASPSKTGNNSEPVDSFHCIPPCVRVCDGTINLTVTPPGTYTFKWSNGATTEDLNGICEGTYTVTITAANGCTTTLTKEVGSTNCNDNNSCTTDACVDGVCTHTAINCDDGNACLIDNCNPETGCVHTPRDCNDNSACTIDNCNPLTGCVYTPRDCNDNIACTTDNCNPLTGCVNSPGPCNDNNECTIDNCSPQTGGCVYTQRDCNDNSACTIDNCNPLIGCVYTPRDCSDQDGCTDDHCNPQTGCVYTPRTCTDNNSCTLDECFGGVCHFTTTTCNDQNSCTNDYCVNGSCIYVPIECGDNNTCTIDECVNGLCRHTPVACNDNEFCTIDECVAGQCRYTPIECEDHNPCTIDICLGVDGCAHLPTVVTVDVAGTNPSSCGACDGSATAIASGGIPPYTYKWSTGATTQSIGIAPPPFNGTQKCIDAGGGPYNGFDADALFTGSTAIYSNNIVADIAGTADDVLFRTERNNISGTMTYSIPVINGPYDVELYFAEIFFGVTGGNTALPVTGKRVFNVAIEGTPVLTNYDINADVGPATATIKTFLTNVSDGFLTISFTNVVNRAKVNGICVKPHQTQGSAQGLCAGTYTVTVTDSKGCFFQDDVELSSQNCDDGNGCTIDICNNNACIHLPANCDDQNSCTIDGCTNGECTHTSIVCNDYSSCTADICINGQCQYIPTTCDDQNSCTTDACVEGECRYTPIVCNDQNQCTTDQCVDGQCIYTGVHIDVDITKTNVSCVCQHPQGTVDARCVLTYDNLQHGTFVNNQFASQGVHISGDANGHIDTLIIFNSNITGTPDPDLEVGVGNLLILPNNITDGDNNGLVDVPNDWAGGGKQIFTFDSPHHISSFIFVDNDQLTSGTATAYDEFNQVIKSVTIPITANGGFVTVNVNASNVKKFIIEYAGSGGAVGRLVICQPDTCCDGTATASGSGGTGPYTYHWSTGQDGASVHGLCPGTYYVTVTDKNGCSKISSVVIGKDNCNNPCDNLNCNDNNGCTADACFDGNCSHTPVVCTDNNACTTDACANNQCVFTPFACNDNNSCTTDACSNGQCVYTPIQGCGECPNAVTSLTLVRPGTGGDVATLTNGYVINYETLCKGFNIRANACLSVVKSVKFILNGSAFRTESSAPYALNGDNSGSYIAWTPAAGSYTLQVIPYTGTGATGTAGTSLTITFTVVGGTSCNDANSCTTDACNTTTGICSHTTIPNCGNNPCANVNCNDNNACTTDACNNGQCSNTPMVCNDQNSCTNDACVNGQCQYTAMVCNDQNSCTNDACVNGQCQYNQMVCNDENSCTTDACANGQCQFTPVVCNDYNACTNDACADGLCRYTPMVCNDGISCTIDACVDGQCQYNAQNCDPCSAAYCDDGNPCTIDVGNGLGGCTHTQSASTPNYLKLVNTNSNSLSLKILYGSGSAWVNQDVAAGGNTTLCITLRDATPAPGTMAKVHVRLKGSLQNEVTRITNNYPVGCVPRGWTTICIPLSAYTTTDLTAVPYVEIFNSAAGPYELHILKIEFTGGSTPFVWFGGSHTNNYISGNTASFSGQLVTGGPCGGAKMSGDEFMPSSDNSGSEVSSFSVFPNPFDNQLNLSLESPAEGNADIRIVDMLGQTISFEKVAVIKGSNKYVMNLDDKLAACVYFLEFRMGEEVKYIKLMKTK